VVIVLHPEQAQEVALLARDLEMDPQEVVRHLLSGPLLTLDSLDSVLATQ
jgi:hypothetical protein